MLMRIRSNDICLRRTGFRTEPIRRGGALARRIIVLSKIADFRVDVRPNGSAYSFPNTVKP